MSVPGTFTTTQLSKTRTYLIDHVKNNGKIIRGSVHGDIFVTYGAVARNIECSIDNEWDGDRVGDLVGAVSHGEHLLGNPLISAIVVRAPDNTNFQTSRMASLIGEGFFKLGMNLGLLKQKGKINPNGIEELTFWNNEILAIVHKYGNNKP